jgi:hypothetical protein
LTQRIVVAAAYDAAARRAVSWVRAGCADFRVVGAQDCVDGIDRDGEGKVDCMDDDCSSSCIEKVCDDGIDNDFDGKVDCDDSNCGGDPNCR